MTDIRTRHPKKTRKRTDRPGGIKKTTDGQEQHLGIPWPSLGTNEPALVRTNYCGQGRIALHVPVS